MSNENKNEFCKCCDSRSVEFEALVEINHCLKKDYAELQKRYEMLTDEKKELEKERKKLEGRINELENRQKSRESEVVREGASNTQQGCNSRASPWEKQCALLESQMVVYKKDFERERQDREKLNEEKEKYKDKLGNAEQVVRMLTAELELCKALEQVRGGRGQWNENDYLSERGVTNRLVNERWQMVNQMIGMLPWNPTPMPLFYGGNEINERRWMGEHTLDNCVPDSLTQATK